MSYQYGGGRANPYNQREESPGGYNSQPYGSAPPQQYARQQYNNGPAMGREEFGHNVEMEPLTGSGGQFAGQGQEPYADQFAGQNPNASQFAGSSRMDPAVLAECKQIDAGLAETKQSLEALEKLQKTILGHPDPTRLFTQHDEESTKILGQYRDLVKRVRMLKSKPGSSTNVHVKRIENNAKLAMEAYQAADRVFQRKLREQMARQYRIVKPEASEQEVRAAVEDTSPDMQIFSQAVSQSNRRGQAQSIQSAVRSRHDEIVKIEQQMTDLAQLFMDMAAMVEQQEEAVASIEMKGEEVVENMDNGNKQIATAITSARNARKWKWWCLGIVLGIILVIVIIVIIYVKVINPPANNNNKSTTKRFVLPTVNHRVVSGQSWSPTPERSLEVPGLKWTRDNKLAALTQGRPVQPGVEWTPSGKKERRFQA